jgi:ribosome biogenesis GTPase
MRLQGKIVKGVGGFYEVLSGGELYTCRARGRFRREGLTPLPGDDVEFTPGAGEELGFVDGILPRRNALRRPAVANVDMLVLVTAMREPEPDLLLLDKLLLSAVSLGVEPSLVINKCDLASPEEVRALTGQYAHAVPSTLAVSAKSGSGIGELMEYLHGKCSCLAGQSGVGKTSLLNRLFPGRDMETGGVSERTSRGRHTTRHAELLILPGGGEVADTPGFSLLEAEAVDPATLPALVPEFASYEGQCRFSGCMHVSEPGCAVKKAAAEGAISPERLQRYAEILAETREKWRNRYD